MIVPAETGIHDSTGAAQRNAVTRRIPRPPREPDDVAEALRVTDVGVGPELGPDAGQAEGVVTVIAILVQ